MFAIIEAGGKQHRVSVGDIVEVDRMKGTLGSTVDLGRVLLVADGNQVTTGKPTVEDARVVSTVLADTRGPKIIVFRYKSKKRERKKTGHRADLTRLRIDDIVVGGVSSRSRTDAVTELPSSTAEMLDAPVTTTTALTEPTLAAGQAALASPSPEVEV